MHDERHNVAMSNPDGILVNKPVLRKNVGFCWTEMKISTRLTTPARAACMHDDQQRGNNESAAAITSFQ